MGIMIANYIPAVKFWGIFRIAYSLFGGLVYENRPQICGLFIFTQMVRSIAVDRIHYRDCRYLNNVIYFVTSLDDVYWGSHAKQDRSDGAGVAKSCH